MAQEVLNQIRVAEDEAQGIINTAQIAARETIREANREAEKLLVETTFAIKQRTFETLDNAEKAAVKVFESEKDALKAAIDAQRIRAEKNIEKASAYILGRIV